MPVVKLAVAGLVPLAALAFVLSSANPSPAARFTRETLADSFDSDIRNLVVEWSPDDPRPVAERRRALFVHLPDARKLGLDSAIALRQQSRDADRRRRREHHHPRPRRPVSWPKKPARADAWHGARHRSESTTDVDRELRDLPHGGDRRRRLLRRRHENLRRPGPRRSVEEPHEPGGTQAAHPQLRGRRPRGSRERHPDAASSRQNRLAHAGALDRLAASHVELYMRPHGGRMPANDEVGRGDVKVPPLWHTAAKAQAGRWHADGSFRGQFPLMASSMELEKDRSFETLEKIVVPTIKEEFETVVRHPGRRAIRMRSIERWRPKAGRSSTRGSRLLTLLGVYDGRGNVVWPGRRRGRGNRPRAWMSSNAAFVEAFRTSPLASHGRLIPKDGYVATPLTGVGQLSLSAQRERADAASSAGTGVGAPEDLQRHGGPAVRSSARRTTVVSGRAIGVAGRSGADRALRRTAGLVQREP